MTEREAVRLLDWDGTPLSCHLMLTAGPRATLGLLSPGDRPIERGDRFTIAFGIWGALTCRAGFVVEDAARAAGRHRRLRRAARRAVLRGGRRVVRGAPDRPDRRRAPGDHRPPPRRPVLRDLPEPGPPDPSRRVGQLADLARLDDRAALGDGVPGRHHPGDRHRLLHDEHRGRHRPRRRGAARGVRGALPGGVGADRGAARGSWPTPSGIDLHPDVLPFSNLPAYLPPFLLRPDRAMTMAD